MGRHMRLSVAFAALAVAAPLYGQDVEEAASRQAVGTDLFYSSGSDETEVLSIGINYDFRAISADEYAGVTLERAWYNPAGLREERRDRYFVRAGHEFGNWQMKARVGTDGDSLVGSLSLNDRSRYRKELFIERDIIEARQGLAQGIYSTFVGAAIDLPTDERNVFTTLVGVQEFSGENVRLHLRGNYVHVVKPELGLSLQLRSRWFRNSEPGEFDYYSPRWYAEILPVVQVRRFTRGWELVGAGGLGIQRDSSSDWRESRYLHARVRSPLEGAAWRFNAALTYTNTPSNNGDVSGYSYVQLMAGAMRAF